MYLHLDVCIGCMCVSSPLSAPSSTHLDPSGPRFPRTQVSVGGLALGLCPTQDWNTFCFRKGELK